MGEYMKAAVLEEFGGPNVLKLTNVVRPNPGDFEVLIAVQTMAVNYVDLLKRQGKLDPKRQGKLDPDNKKNKIRLGYDCCGVIMIAGAKVTKFAVNDEVCALLEGEGYAEYVVAHETMVVRAPPDPYLSWEICALLPYAGTALMLSLVKLNPMKTGQSILIHGGAGGLGSLALQFAKHIGLKVFATVELKEHMQFCLDLGVDVCINTTLEIYDAKVLDETQGSGVDCILDCSNRDNIDINRDIKCLAKNGSLVFMGSQLSKVNLDLVSIAEKRILLLGSDFRQFSKSNKEELLQLLEENMWPVIEDNDFDPMICQTFHIDNVQAAHELMESKEHAGRIVLTTYHDRPYKRRGYKPKRR